MSGLTSIVTVFRSGSKVGASVAACLWVLILFVSPAGAAGPFRNFRIPAGDAATTLRVFSQQSGEQILYPVDQVRGIWTQRVFGALPTTEALERMLALTGLEVRRDPESGAIAITRTTPDPTPEWFTSSPTPRSAAPRPPRTGEAAPEPAPDGVPVTMSAFEVRSYSDFGYKAANAVSATRMALPIAHLPISISAFTEEFIADQKAYDLYDIVRWAPGVHQDNISPQGWVRYNIRGFTSAGVQRNGFSSFRFIDTTNVERVEVVKGPASLLYGQINPGGVINYVTKRPETQPAVRVSGSVGTHGYTRAMVDATGPVGEMLPDLYFRAIGMREDIQRFQVGARGEKYVFAPSLTWRISDHISLTLDYERFKRSEDMLTSGVVLIYADGLPTVPYPGLPWDFSYAGEGDYQDFVSDALMAEFNARIGERWNVRAAFLDATWDMEWRATGQGGTGLLPQSVIDAFYSPGTALTPPHAMYRRNRWEHQWGGERTAQLDVLGRFTAGRVRIDALVGAKWNLNTRYRGIQKNNPTTIESPLYLKPWDLRTPSTWDRRVPFGADDLLTTAHTRAANHGSSIYGVAAVTLWDERLRMLTGYAHHRLANEAAQNLVSQTTSPPSDRAATVPQAGALLKLTNGLSAFLSYSESFLANPTLLRVNNVPLIPATPSVGRGLEAGFKLDLFDGRVSGTVSAYRIRASPTGVVTVTSGIGPDGTTLFTDLQGGLQVSEGMELDLLFSPSANLQVMTSFSHCEAVYRDHPTQPAFNGTRLVATPDRTANLWAKYVVSDGPLNGLILAGGISYVGSMTYVANNPFVRTPSYATIDLTIGYRFAFLGERWTADLSVKNVTDRQYYASASSWGFPRHAIFSLSTQF